MNKGTWWQALIVAASGIVLAMGIALIVVSLFEVRAIYEEKQRAVIITPTPQSHLRDIRHCMDDPDDVLWDCLTFRGKYAVKQRSMIREDI